MSGARRILAGTATAIAGLALIAALAAGWHYADEILGPEPRPEPKGERILGRTDSTITLETSARALRLGPRVLEWPGGFGRVGAASDTTRGRITRTLRVVRGGAPDRDARITGFAFDADPGIWLGYPFENVRIDARVGPLPAWFVPGADSTWVILVHGRGANRAETLRMMPAFHAIGLPMLVIEYRNDVGAPRAGGGYHLGATEWLDLEDAVRWALAHGARRVVPMGCSMGGGIVAEFLRHSPLRTRVPAAVLDAPALDWTTVLDTAAADRGVPRWLTRLAMAIVTLRTGLDWGEVDQLRHTREFVTPMLVFHGERDDSVPLALSVRFAEARPDLVTLVRTPGANHVESWNADSARYDRFLTRWLERWLGG